MLENIEIVITASEETALNIGIKTDTVLQADKPYTSVMVEPWEYERATNPAWIRETLLFDIEKINTRCEVAEVIIKLYQIVASDPEIVQLTLKNGDTKVVKKKNVYDITNPLYDDIETDVTHIEKHRQFFKTSGEIGVTEADEEYNSYNIINKECEIFYIGYEENDEYVKNNPNTLEQKSYFIKDFDQISKLLDDKEKGKIPAMVLVVNPENIEIGCTILDKYFDPIDIVICDTFAADDRTSCLLLSIAKRRGVMIARSICASGVYNFGVNGNGNSESKVGLLNIGNEIITNDWNFIIVADPRFAMIRDFIITLNMRKGVDIILVNHVIYDDHLRELDNYNVFPEYQTTQWSQVDQLSRGHVLHTPIAVLTPIPGIATLLVECGNFATCRLETLMEYKDKVLKALEFVPPIEELEDEDEDDVDTPQKEIDNVLLDKFERFNIQEKNLKCLKQIKSN